MIDESKGGVLSPPRLGHLLCQVCAKRVAGIHAVHGSTYWERLGPVFNASEG
jgi:hypothetical protein